MRIKFVLLMTIISLLYINTAFAKRYWTEPLSSWRLHMDNSHIYLYSPEMPSHCQYSRAIIRADDNAYNKAMYSFALSASAQKNSVRVVIDDTQISTPCVISGID
jgi:hypothetical protein